MRKRDIVALFAAVVMAGFSSLHLQYTRMKVVHGCKSPCKSFSEQLQKDSYRVLGYIGSNRTGQGSKSRPSLFKFIEHRTGGGKERGNGADQETAWSETGTEGQAVQEPAGGGLKESPRRAAAAATNHLNKAVAPKSVDSIVTTGAAPPQKVAAIPAPTTSPPPSVTPAPTAASPPTPAAVVKMNHGSTPGSLPNVEA